MNKEKTISFLLRLYHFGDVFQYGLAILRV